MSGIGWNEVRAARVPSAKLDALAPLRCRPNVIIDGDWLHFAVGDEEVLEALRPVEGLKFLGRRGGDWFQFGSRVPTAEHPRTECGVSLERFLLPGKFEINNAVAHDSDLARPALVPDKSIKPATALRCSLPTLKTWAETALSAELESLRAAMHGSEVFLMGNHLPSFLGRSSSPPVRYHGKRVFVPLGHRPDPDWPEDWLRQAASVKDDAFLVIDHAGVSILPAAAFQSLSRAAVRLAKGGMA